MLRSKAEYIEDCARKEEHLRARKLATDAELDEYRPAGKSAPKEAWVFWWAQLVGYCRRLETREPGFDHEAADAEILGALIGSPRKVHLRDSHGDVPAFIVAVHPKSFETLYEFFHARECLMVQLAARVEELRQSATMTDWPLLSRAMDELSYQTHLVAWASCTEGEGLPFDKEAREVAIPAPFASLYSSEIIRISEAFMTTNATQLNALERLVAPARPGTQSERPSWSIFFGQLSMRLKVPTDQLMRDYPLTQLLATVKLAAPATEEEELEEAMT